MTPRSIGTGGLLFLDFMQKQFVELSAILSFL